jgi:RNA polymerase sigma-70 factor (ECF subfamily)
VAEGFRDFHDRYRGFVTRKVSRMVGRSPDAEDLVQEVMLQAARSLGDLRDREKLAPWVRMVTVRVVLMHRRAAKRRPAYSGAPPEDSTPGESEMPDEGAARRERGRAFGRLLGRLSEKKREAFVLHDVEGLSPAEVAGRVGAPVLTVRTRLFYARRELSAMLAEEPSLGGILTAER